MHRGLGRAAVRRAPAAALRVVGAAQLDDLAGTVLDHFLAGDEVGRAQADLAAGREPEELLRRVLHEVFALDEELPRKRDLPRTGRRILGVVDRVELLDLALGVVREHDLERSEHRHPPRRRAVQQVAHAMLEHLVLDDALAAAHPDQVGELAQGRGGKAPAADAGDRGHAGIVPPAHPAFVDEAQQKALGKHGVGQVEPRELVLPRPRGHGQVLEVPVVERTVVFVLQGADRVGDALDGIRLPVRVVVHRIDAPGLARARMRRVEDAVHDGVTQVDVARSHVDLRAQDVAPIRELAATHAVEQVEVLFHRPVAPGSSSSRAR